MAYISRNGIATEYSTVSSGTDTILCLSEKLGAFDKENIIVPIALI